MSWNHQLDADSSARRDKARDPSSSATAIRGVSRRGGLAEVVREWDGAKGLNLHDSQPANTRGSLSEVPGCWPLLELCPRSRSRAPCKVASFAPRPRPIAALRMRRRPTLDPLRQRCTTVGHRRHHLLATCAYAARNMGRLRGNVADGRRRPRQAAGNAASLAAPEGGAPWNRATVTTPLPFEPTSKRRHGFPSETQVKRGYRVVHGDKVLVEKLGRNDPCPCGSARRFQAMLPPDRQL